MDEVLRQYFDWDQAQPYFGDLARGFWVTLQIAFIAELICLSLGMVLALMRQAGRGATTRGARIGGAVLRGIAVVYITVFVALAALLVLLLMAGSFPFLPIPVIQDLTAFQIACSFRKSCAFLMQVAKVRASLRHGITIDTSGSTEPTSEIKGSRPFDPG